MYYHLDNVKSSQITLKRLSNHLKIKYEVIGIIKEILPQGIVFEIEKSQKPSRYREGKNVFIAYSANLIFIEV